jgi:hypothetical protein
MKFDGSKYNLKNNNKYLELKIIKLILNNKPECYKNVMKSETA